MRVSDLTEHKKESQKAKHFKHKEKILGQFFTPKEVSDFIVSFAVFHLKQWSSGCDPACGDGVFLSSMITHGFTEVVGMDIDEKCVRLIPEDVKKRAKVLVGDALLRTTTLDGRTPLLQENYFDIVVGNPPFSAKYGRVREKAILASYELGANSRSQAIEILFLERFIQLAKKGGIIGIILPDGIFLNLNYQNVRNFVLKKCKILAVISLPRGIFNGTKSTTSKTSIPFAMKGQKHKGKALLPEITNLRELKKVFDLYKQTFLSKNAENWIEITAESFHPKSYINLSFLSGSKLPIFKLKDLIQEMRCGQTEYGPNRKFYDRGIRFISAKVVTPIGLDFTRDNRKFIKPGSSMDKKRAYVEVEDLLFVRVGVGCIGRAAVVIDQEDLGVADDWIYIIKVKKEICSPYYLAMFLQSKYGKIQIDKAKRGVGTVTIPQKLLKDILVPLPEKDFQDKIESKYKEMVKLTRKGAYDQANKIYESLIKEIERKLKG